MSQEDDIHHVRLRPGGPEMPVRNLIPPTGQDDLSYAPPPIVLPPGETPDGICRYCNDKGCQYCDARAAGVGDTVQAKEMPPRPMISIMPGFDVEAGSAVTIVLGGTGYDVRVMVGTGDILQCLYQDYETRDMVIDRRKIQAVIGPARNTK